MPEVSREYVDFEDERDTDEADSDDAREFKEFDEGGKATGRKFGGEKKSDENMMDFEEVGRRDLEFSARLREGASNVGERAKTGARRTSSFLNEVRVGLGKEFGELEDEDVGVGAMLGAGLSKGAEKARDAASSDEVASGVAFGSGDGMQMGGGGVDVGEVGEVSPGVDVGDGADVTLLGDEFKGSDSDEEDFGVDRDLLF